MKLSTTPGALSLIALAVLALPASAQTVNQADDAGWYVGAGVGQSKAKIDNERINSSLMGNGFATTSIENDDHDTGYKVFGGYQFNKYFAVEGGYFDLGKFGYKATTLPAGTLNGTMKVDGLNLDLVGILPFTDKFSAFGRIGANYAHTRDSFFGAGAVNVTNPNPSRHQLNHKFGVGLQYSLTSALDVRAEAERYRINDAVGRKGDVDLLSVGLIYRFGKKATAPAVYQPLPEPVAAAPEPVVVAPPPPAPVPRKVSFSADSLFEFNESTMKPAGRQDVDKLANDLRGANFNVIRITGHTDRIGSHDYNMKLSTRRAEAVKAYLVDSTGIPADKITATGVSESEPVTKPEDCIGKKATRKLIACLQPDRRVEVEVDGTKGTQ